MSLNGLPWWVGVCQEIREGKVSRWRKKLSAVTKTNQIIAHFSAYLYIGTVAKITSQSHLVLIKWKPNLSVLQKPAIEWWQLGFKLNHGPMILFFNIQIWSQFNITLKFLSPGSKLELDYTFVIFSLSLFFFTSHETCSRRLMTHPIPQI